MRLITLGLWLIILFSNFTCYWIGYNHGETDTIEYYETIPAISVDLLALPTGPNDVTCHPNRVPSKLEEN